MRQCKIGLAPKPVQKATWSGMNHHATVSTNTPRKPVTPLSLRFRASALRKVGKLGMALPEASADAAPSEAQRLWKLLARPLVAAGVWPERSLSTWARPENAGVRFRYR